MRILHLTTVLGLMLFMTACSTPQSTALKPSPSQATPAESQPNAPERSRTRRGDFSRSVDSSIPVQAILPPETPLPPEEDSKDVNQFSFIVYGDTRGRRDGTAIQYEHSLIVDSMLRRIRQSKQSKFPVKFVLQTGDAVVNGRDPRQWNVSYVELVNRLTQQGGVPYFLAPGNHDVTSAKDINSTNRLKGLKNYLSALTHLIPPDGAPRRLEGYPTYAFGYGNTFVLAIDSNIAWDKKQYEWIKAQLEGLDSDRYMNIFAFFHHPPFSSGPHGGAKVEEPAKEIREQYMPLFRKHRVDAILTGHEHLFEHWVERYGPSRTESYRLDHIITGGGGAPLYGFQGVPDTAPYTRMFRSERVSLEHLVKPGPEPGDNPYHYVIVQVDRGFLSLEVIAVDWGRDYKPYRRNWTDLAEPW